MNNPIIKTIQVRDVVFGHNVTLVEPSNIYGCKIGDNTFIGPFVEIQKDVTIGKNCRIQSHTFICEMVSIGDNCFISHGAMFINYLFKNGKLSGGDKSLWAGTKIGNNVIIGTNATVLPVSIVDDVIIGAGSVVTKDITEPGVYAGNPVRKLRE